MKRNTGYVSVRTAMQMLVGIVLFSAGNVLTACSSDEEKGKKVIADGEGRSVQFQVTRAMTRADAAGVDVMNNLALFAFTEQQLYDFTPEADKIEISGNTLTISELDPAVLDFVLVSCATQDLSSDPQFTAPQPGESIADAIMYTMSPDVANKYLQPMPELLYDSIAGIDLQEADAEATATLVRNVARIDVVVEYDGFDTGLFSQYPDLCFLELWDVPTTLKWNGELYPDKNQPDLATVPLHQTISFNSSDGNVTDTVRFIVPAHRGSDFAEDNPQDITTSLLKLKASLPHPDKPGESFFAGVGGSQLIEIPVAPKMNWILEVKFIFHGPLQPAQLDVQVTVKEWDTYEQYENF